MKQGRGDWRQYRDSLEGPVIEVDFHRSDCGPREIPYEQAMSEVESDTLDALKRAFDMGLAHAIFCHGHSTSSLGRTTARSVIRGLMRGAYATAYIVRRDCIQHDSVFVASIRPNPDAIAPKLACPTAVRQTPRLGHLPLLGISNAVVATISSTGSISMSGMRGNVVDHLQNSLRG